MTPSLSPDLAAPPPRRAGGWIALGLLLAAVGGIALAIRMQSAVPQRFTVTHGASVREVAAGLRRQGLIWHPWTFKIWTRLNARPGIRPGVYNLSPRMTSYQIYKAFRQGPPVVRVTFPEGWTAQQMGAHLESLGITAAQPFVDAVAAGQKEGFLFPDTYFFEQGIDPQQVMDRMIHRFHEKEPKDFTERAKALKLSYKQLVTLASLVEKEARFPEERPKIAGVYLNRIKKHMLLEADPTVQYALGGWKAKLHYKDLQIDSPYNTYKHPGLPPGPIANPGAASLEAAAHPEATDALFFVADATGHHVFTKTYQEHMAVQKKMRRERAAP